MNRFYLSALALLGAAMPMVMDSAFKGAALLAVAAVAALALWRASAAARHLVWLVAVLALLLVPVLSVVLPGWRVLPAWAVAPVVPAVEDRTYEPHRPYETYSPTVAEPAPLLPSAPAEQPLLSAEAVPPPAPAPAVAPPPPATLTLHKTLPALWLGGCALLLVRLLSAHWLLRRASRRCQEVSTDKLTSALAEAAQQLGVRQRIRFLLDEKRTIPVVWGVIRPRLILPAESLTWDDSKLRSVLLHELAHISRRDTLVQWLTQLACALHWFNPLVWLAAWRLHTERERACDDLVLASGVKASAYAGHLLDVASKLTPARWTSACGLAMARKSSLESRLRAVLSGNLNRCGVTRLLALASVVLTAAVVVPLAMLRAAEAEKPKSAETPVNAEPKTAASKQLLDHWKRSARADGKIPGGCIGQVAASLKTYMDLNAGTEAATKCEPVLKKCDASHDWLPSDAAALLDEIEIVAPDHAAWTMRAINERQIHPGKPLPDELEDAPWGTTADNGLRMAWLLEPNEDKQPLDRILKSRILFHNSGKAPVCFATEDWLQSGRHTAKAATGKGINIHATQRMGIRSGMIFRLAPGEYAEVVGHGIGIGSHETAKETDIRKVGAWIEAKEGDAVTFTPGKLLVSFQTWQNNEGRKDSETVWQEIISARLAQEGPNPASEKDRAALLARVSADLGITLPYDEAKFTYENDPFPDAFERLTKRFLEAAKPMHFAGELSGGETKFTVTTKAKDPSDKSDQSDKTSSNPPAAEADLGGLQPAGKIIIQVKADGTYVIQKETQTLKQIEDRLATIAAVNKQRHITIRAEKEAPNESVVSLLGVCQNLELDQVSLIGEVQPPDVTSSDFHIAWLNMISSKLKDTDRKLIVTLRCDDTLILDKAEVTPQKLAGTLFLRGPVKKLSVHPDPDMPANSNAVIIELNGKREFNNLFPKNPKASQQKLRAAREAFEAELKAQAEQLDKLTKALESTNPAQPKNLPAKQPAAQIIIQVRPDGTYVIQKEELTFKQLEERLATLAAVNKEQTITIKAEKATAMKFVSKVMEACGKTGLNSISFAEPKPDAADLLKAKEALQAELKAQEEKIAKLDKALMETNAILKDNAKTLEKFNEQQTQRMKAISLSQRVGTSAPVDPNWTSVTIVMESKYTGPTPKHEYAQALFKQWRSFARADGKIPGALIGHVAEQMDSFLKQYPTDTKAAALAAIRPRLDATHDWTPEDVVTLMDDITEISTAPISWASTPMEFAQMNKLLPGKPLPEELQKANWGKPAENGLRVAMWLPTGFDSPPIMQPIVGGGIDGVLRYPLNTVLKARVLFHNTGTAPVIFRTETWHQNDRHSAKDADDSAINVSSSWYTGITPIATYRLAPGEYAEVPAHGIAIGAGKYEEEHSTGSVGAVIEATAGQTVRFSTEVDAINEGWTRPNNPKDPTEIYLKNIADRIALEAPLPKSTADRELLIIRAMQDLFGQPPTEAEVAMFTTDVAPDALEKLTARLQAKPRPSAFSGKLQTGETIFKVLPADPNAATAPRTAIGPGRYVLGDNVHLQVTQTTEGDKRTNKATILFLSPDPKVASPHKPYEIALNDGLDAYALAWVRGTQTLWIKEFCLLRKLDFADPAKITETSYSGYDTTQAPIPKDLREALRISLPSPTAPKKSKVFPDRSTPDVPASGNPKEAGLKLTPDALIGTWRGKVNDETLMLSFHRPPAEKEVQLDIYQGKATIGALARFTIADDGSSAVVVMDHADSATFGTLRRDTEGTLNLELHNRQKGQTEVKLTRDSTATIVEPQQAESRELFEIWRRTASDDGLIPGTFIGKLATEVRAYVKANQNLDSGMKLPKLLPRFVTSHAWTQADVIKLLDDVGYYSTAPIQTCVAKSKNPTDALEPTKMDLQDIPVQINKWSEPLRGLRIGLHVVGGEWKIGGKVKLALWLHNTSDHDITFDAAPTSMENGVTATAVDATGKAHRSHGLGSSRIEVRPTPCTLPAGSVAAVKIFELPFENGNPDDFRKAPKMIGLKPGNCKLTCSWMDAAGLDEGKDWRGTLQAPELEFTLADNAKAEHSQSSKLPQQTRQWNDKYSAVAYQTEKDVDFVLIYEGFISTGLSESYSDTSGKWSIEGNIHLVDTEKTKAAGQNVDKRVIALKHTSDEPTKLYLDGKAYDLASPRRATAMGALQMPGRIFILRDEGEPIQTDRTLALRNVQDLVTIGDFAARDLALATQYADSRRARAMEGWVLGWDEQHSIQHGDSERAAMLRIFANGRVLALQDGRELKEFKIPPNEVAMLLRWLAEEQKIGEWKPEMVKAADGTEFERDPVKNMWDQETDVLFFMLDGKRHGIAVEQMEPDAQRFNPIRERLMALTKNAEQAQAKSESKDGIALQPATEQKHESGEPAKAPGSELMGDVLEPTSPEGHAQGPLILGLRTASDAQWCIGGTAKVGLVARNRSDSDVKFAYSDMLDSGLSIVAIDESGNKHPAEVSRTPSGFVKRQQMMLPRGHMATVREFTIRFDAGTHDPVDSHTAAFNLAPGKYKLSCKWSDASPTDAHQGEWHGELVNDAFEMTILIANGNIISAKPGAACAVISAASTNNTYQLAPGLSMVVRTAIYHSADTMTDVTVHWAAKEDRPAMNANFQVASDTMGNHQRWVVLWENGTPTLWFATEKPLTVNESENTPHEFGGFVRIDLGDPNYLISYEYNGVPETDGPSPAVMEKLVLRMNSIKWGTEITRTLRWATTTKPGGNAQANIFVFTRDPRDQGHFQVNTAKECNLEGLQASIEEVSKPYEAETPQIVLVGPPAHWERIQDAAEAIRAWHTSAYSGRKSSKVMTPVPDSGTTNGSQMQPATEQKLKWGEPANGLRMALAWAPTSGEPALGVETEFYLVVQNVSDAPVHFLANADALNPRKLTIRKDGKPLSTLNDPTVIPGDWLLKPREVAFIKLFQPLENGDGKASVSATVEADVRAFPQYSLTAEMSIEKAPEGAWTGKLVTGATRGSLDVIPPQNKDAQALLKAWSNAMRMDGKIPGGLIGKLSESVQTFIKSNPTWATTPQLQKLLPRLDATRDWSGEDAVALLNELSALQETVIQMALERETQHVIRTGTPLPAELAKAPWGETLANGLRHAWLLEPNTAEHALGAALKARTLIHNAGKEPVTFRTRSWHQLGHKATDAQGVELKTESVEFMTRGILLTYRLAPGEFIEVNSPGIGMEKMGQVEKDGIAVGTWVEAQAGDEVSISTTPIPLMDWNEEEQLKLDGEPRWWLDYIRARLARHLPFPEDQTARERLLYRVAMELFGTPVSAEINAAFVADKSPKALDALAELLFHRQGQQAWAGNLQSGVVKFRVTGQK